MRAEYKIKSLKKRNQTRVRESADAAKIPISLRVDGSVLAALRTEAERLGIPYQTLISSILHRFAQGDLVDPKALDLNEILKKAS